MTQQLFQALRTDIQDETTALITGPSVNIYANYFELELPALLAGDTLIVTADGEVEIPITYNTEVISQLTMGAWCGTPSQLDPGCYEIGHIIGSDLSLGPIHYFLPVRSIIFKVPVDIPKPTPARGPWIQYRIRCKSTDAPGYDRAILKTGQGHLACAIFR